MARFGVVLASCVLFASSPARGDTLHNVATALDFSGFDARGSLNPLSGGADLLITRTFNGNLFDFGPTELALQGPISLQVSTGGRLVPEFDISLTTAVNARNQAGPLNFTYASDIGPQSTTVTGSMLIDSHLSINALGFYDLTLTSSARNTVRREGVVTGTNTFDSDVGPISVSGNIFADALAVLVDPLFEQTGRENPFAAFSKVLINPVPDGPVDLSSLPDVRSEFLAEAGRSSEARQHAASRGNQNKGGQNAVVPEPPVLILLLLGLPVILRRAVRTG